jgi:hypothetical protein
MLEKAIEFRIVPFIDEFQGKNLPYSLFYDSFSKQLFLTLLDNFEKKYPSVFKLYNKRSELREQFVIQDEIFIQKALERIEFNNKENSKLPKLNPEFKMGDEMLFFIIRS